jgi:hypothetical protein
MQIPRQSLLLHAYGCLVLSFVVLCLSLERPSSQCEDIHLKIKIFVRQE